MIVKVRGLVEAFGIAFANYGLVTAISMPLFGLCHGVPYPYLLKIGFR